MQKRFEREIISSFPYPIASRFIRLRTRQCKKPSYARLNHIFGTAEIITRYLAVIVISECRAQLESNSDLEGRFLREFIIPIKRPSWGHWIAFIREGLRWLLQLQVELTVPELHDFWFNHRLKPTKAATLLSELVSMRNEEIGHNFQGLQESEYESLCDETWYKLSVVLEALDFLPDYELRFIHRIEVSNIRRQPTVFIHEYSSAIGCIDDFEAGDDDEQGQLLETEATLLLNPETRRYLNLEPFLIYENIIGRAPDIFFYIGMTMPEKAQYEACKHGGKFNLNEIDPKSSGEQHKVRMIDELQHFITLFSREGSQ